MVDNDLCLEKIQHLTVKIKLPAFKPQIGRLFLCLVCRCEESFSSEVGRFEGEGGTERAGTGPTKPGEEKSVAPNFPSREVLDCTPER